MSISTEKELGDALKNNQDSIEIEGDLSKKLSELKQPGRLHGPLQLVQSASR